MSMVDVLFRDYVGSLRVSASSVAVINVRLKKAAPAHLSPAAKNALKLVDERANDVAEVLAERDRQAPARVRPLLTQCVGDWTSFADSLAAKARVLRISGDENRADQIYVSLFPNGMDFAQTDAETTWSEAHRLLTRIEHEDMKGALKSLLGPEFLDAITASTEALGNAIGTGSSDRIIPSSTALAEALMRFGRAVGKYGRVLSAETNEEDDESVAQFLKAMAPVDAHRAGMREGGSSSSDATDAPETTQPTTTQPTTTSAPTASNGATPAPVTNGANGTV